MRRSRDKLETRTMTWLDRAWLTAPDLIGGRREQADHASACQESDRPRTVALADILPGTRGVVVYLPTQRQLYGASDADDGETDKVLPVVSLVRCWRISSVAMFLVAAILLRSPSWHIIFSRSFFGFLSRGLHTNPRCFDQHEGRRSQYLTRPFQSSRRALWLFSSTRKHP